MAAAETRRVFASRQRRPSDVVELGFGFHKDTCLSPYELNPIAGVYNSTAERQICLSFGMLNPV